MSDKFLYIKTNINYFSMKWEENDMKRKVLSTLLAVTMVAGLLTGCGGSSTTTSDSGTTAAESTATTDNAAEATDDSAAAETTAVEATDEGKVLNIYCWNEELKM